MSNQKKQLTEEDVDLARRIRESRVAANLTQEQMATRAGISARTLKRIEAGRAAVSVPVLRRIGRITSADPHDDGALGVARETVARWETGASAPQGRHFAKLASAVSPVPPLSFFCSHCGRKNSVELAP